MPCVINWSSRFSLADIASSSDIAALSPAARRYAFSTSSAWISRPSTTAQTSGEAGAAGCEPRHAADAHVMTSAKTKTNKERRLAISIATLYAVFEQSGRRAVAYVGPRLPAELAES